MSSAASMRSVQCSSISEILATLNIAHLETMNFDHFYF